MTVCGKHGIAQLRKKTVCILWSGSVFYFPVENLDEIIALLQALQQELDLKQAENTA